jgi:hypothetical protein
MSRFLEAVFVLGCSLVGFGMSVDAGSAVQRRYRIAKLFAPQDLNRFRTQQTVS